MSFFNKSLTKQEILDLAEQITVSVIARSLEVRREDGSKQGLIHFAWSATEVKDENGYQVGSIRSEAGAITVVIEGESWTIMHDDLWYAVEQAIRLREGKEE